jgi:hypothetical protein
MSLNQNCSSPQELSNGVSHSTWAHRNWVDSWLLVVGSQIANLTLDLSFDHNLCYRYPNGSYETILNIYTSKPFRWYKEHFNTRCFDPCNQALNFWESQRTPSSHFWECEFHPHTFLKVGSRQAPIERDMRATTSTNKYNGGHCWHQWNITQRQPPTKHDKQ